MSIGVGIGAGGFDESTEVGHRALVVRLLVRVKGKCIPVRVGSTLRLLPPLPRILLLPES